MKVKCLTCGHIQERRKWARTKAACSRCHSRNVTSHISNSTPEKASSTITYSPHVQNGKEKSEKARKKAANELLHRKGKDEIVNSAGNVFLGILSLKVRDLKGHGRKAANEILNLWDTKREIFENGGDMRLIGDNIRKIRGAEDELGVFGFGIVPLGKEGVLGKALSFEKRNKERREEDEKENEQRKNEQNEEKGGCFY